MMTPLEMQTFSTAACSRILCAITFHFSAARTPFLTDVLLSLAEFPVTKLDVVIVTNTIAPADLDKLEKLCEAVPSISFSLQTEPDLENPRELTWRHKRLLVERFLAPSLQPYTHFIYLEDDIRVSFVNFCYFLEAREKLRQFGLIPAFLRTECCKSINSLTCSDAFWPIYAPVQPKVIIDGNLFLNMPNPYNPIYILDHDLASHYVTAASFNIDQSSSVCSWGIQERAAMGMCLEDVPSGFYSRYVVPVSRQTGKAVPQAIIRHLPDNYANDPRSVLGKVSLANLFIGVFEVGDDDEWLTARATDDSSRQSAPVNDIKRWPVNPSLLSSADAHSYLVTHHDTIVYWDLNTKSLRHGPYGSVPLNVLFKPETHFGSLVVRESDCLPIGQPSFESEQVAFPLVDNDKSTRRFVLQAFPDDTLSIRLGSDYMGAEYGGKMTTKQWCSDWERFALVKSQLIDGLELLKSRYWKSHSDEEIVTLHAQPIRLRPPRPAPEASALAATFAPAAKDFKGEILFGPARILLSDVTCEISATLNAAGLPVHVRIKDITGVEFLFSPASEEK